MISIPVVIVIVWVSLTILMSFTAETALLVWTVNIILIFIVIVYVSIKKRYSNRRKTFTSVSRKVLTRKKSITTLSKEAGWSTKKIAKQLNKHGRKKTIKKLNKKLR